MRRISEDPIEEKQLEDDYEEHNFNIEKCLMKRNS